MSNIPGPEIIGRFEEVLNTNLGLVGKFLLEQKLNEAGKTKETFSQEDVDRLIMSLKEEFSKVIGYGVDKLEIDLRKVLTKSN